MLENSRERSWRQQEHGIELPAFLAQQLHALNERLVSGTFTGRSPGSSRRSDASIEHLDLQSDGFGLQLRLNAFRAGKSAIIHFQCNSEVAFATTLMVRESKMGGDDRSLFAIPATVQDTDLPLIENLIYGSCACVGRGSVRQAPGSEACTQSFQLFLPSVQPLPYFNADFEIVGLPSLY